jgi:hypothetical protein
VDVRCPAVSLQPVSHCSRLAATLGDAAV